MTDHTPTRSGRMEVIRGCMFSGKSDALIARVEEARRAGRHVAVFKHASDNRYDPADVVTHDQRHLAAAPIERAAELATDATDADVIAVDEAHFFDAGLPAVCRQLADDGKRVILAGLDRDAWGLPFGPMPRLAELADEITTTTAICAVCGATACRTQRITPIGESMIGGEGDYEPRCEKCFVPPPAELWR